tara:strand:+ start:3187 stop:3423 length:237 start_codon:yes stop_codon:yes gene_type:complete
MAFKMRSNPMQRNFGSALKHYRDEDGKVLNVHGHKSKDGDTTHHGESRATGRKSTYKRKGDTLVRNPGSSFGQNKFDE